ncbi:hypothetical protein TNCV_3768901 [Trichonephila clavipes]|nr:hypothetical protein TNCV_3768901 [Trichonephila clavipes]
MRYGNRGSHRPEAPRPIHRPGRYMFGAAIILAVIQGIRVTFMPNSHHYLLVKGETDKVNDTSISLITSSFQHSTRTYHFNKIMYRTIVL